MVVQQAQAQDATHATERKRLQDIAMRHCETGQQLALHLKVAEKKQEKAVVQAQKAVAQAEEAEAEVQQTKKEAAAQKRENKLTKRKLKSAGKKDHVLWWCRGEIFN